MLPLATSDFPVSHEALTKALEDGLKKHGIVAKKVAPKGGAFPDVDELTIDLSGATVTRETRLPVAKAKGGKAVKVGHFILRAAPLRLEKTPVRLSLEAHGTEFEFGRDEKKERRSFSAARRKETWKCRCSAVTWKR
jgi:hypothetical protein